MAKDTIDKIKDLLGIEVKSEEVKPDVVLAEEEEVKEVEKEEVKEAVADYATKQELSDIRNELFSMIKTIIESNEKNAKEVPQELSTDKKEEVELKEEPKEIVHSPENEIKKEKVMFSKPLGAMSIKERINEMLNNK